MFSRDVGFDEIFWFSREDVGFDEICFVCIISLIVCIWKESCFFLFSRDVGFDEFALLFVRVVISKDDLMS